MDMLGTITFGEWELSLRETLGRLYDPTFRVPDLFWRILNIDDPLHERASIWSALEEAIESLHVGTDVQVSARARRVYDVLSYRYIQQLTQEQTAERLNISTRHLRREQQDAIRVLALWLLDRNPEAAAFVNPPLEAPEIDERASEERTPSAVKSAPPLAGEESDWREQISEELASLAKLAPGSISDVRESLRSAVALQQVLAVRRGVELNVGGAQEPLWAAIHSSALRQALVATIGMLLENVHSGQIDITAAPAGSWVEILFAGQLSSGQKPETSDLITAILASYGGSIDLSRTAERLLCRVSLPLAEHVTVLLIDDNEDLAHFFQRYLEGTRFRVVHIPQGRRALESVGAVRPDVILLDVMLADVDGWEVLTYLHGNPDTQAIPVIICSVSRDEELGLALGATSFLPKPVHRAQLLRSLEGALQQRES